MKNTDVPATLRDMWETRPARPRDGRVVAGVAAAIGRRYDIDPVLIRVGFVVAALSGVGALLYVLGWLVLPETPAEPGAPPRRAAHPLLAVLVVVAAVAGIGSLFGRGGNIVVPLVAVAALLFLMHHFRGDRTPAAPAAAPGVSLVKGEQDAEPPLSPPAWDPLGAAPFAWDLPEPAAPPPPPAPRKPPVTAVTLGLALLATGVTGAVLLLVDGLSLAGVAALFGVALAIIGTGLVVGSFLRTGRGLIPIALLLIAMTWGALSAPWDRFDRADGFSDITERPTTVSALAPSYSRTAGDISLDLRGLDLSLPPGATATPAQTRISLGAGDVQVWVPPTADVTFTAEVGMGDIEFDRNHRDSGPGAHVAVTNDLGIDQMAGGRPLVIDVSSGAGSVEVHRG